MEKRRSKLIVYWTNLGSFTRRSRVTEHLMGSSIWLSNFSCRRAIRTSFLTLWSRCPKSWRSNALVAMKHHNSSLDDEIDSSEQLSGIDEWLIRSEVSYFPGARMIERF